MPKAKRNPEEGRALLLGSESDFDGPYRDSYPIYKTAINRGVANHVGKWPSHLFAAFLAASLVFAAFILFAIVSALFCAPNATYRCRRWKNIEFTEFPNIYFVKHANRTWSTKELCYVESTARDNPEINVYLINLLEESPEENHFLTVETEKTKATKDQETIELLWEKANNSMENVVDLSTELTPEAKIRRKLATHYINVRNVDVSISDFFEGSMLAFVCRKLDLKTLEIAAKAFVLWNTPGVALNPYGSRYLKGLRTYLCKGCESMKTATIDRGGSIQASGVPCQAFIGCLIHEIATRGSAEDWKVVKEAQASFCRRAKECPGLKILNEDTHQVAQSTTCPIIYPSEAEPTNFKNFSTRTPRIRPELSTKKEENIESFQ